MREFGIKNRLNFFTGMMKTDFPSNQPLLTDLSKDIQLKGASMSRGAALASVAVDSPALAALVVTGILCALLVGCTSAPVARKTTLPQSPARRTVVIPPLPPVTKVTAKRQATARVTASVVPTTVPEERPVYIVPYGPGHQGVIGVQTNSPGGTLEFCMSPSVAGQSWQSLSTPFWVAQGETMMVTMPNNWLPERRWFVNVKSVSGPAPAAARTAAGVDSGKTIKWKGKQYRLVEVTRPGAQFPMYRLQL